MNRVTNYIEENYPDYMDKILLADGFEDAFIGVVESFGTAPKACYNYDGCIEILVLTKVKLVRPLVDCGDREDVLVRLEEEAMSYDEAVEYLEFNVTQAYVGEHTPAFIRLDLGEQKL